MFPINLGDGISPLLPYRPLHSTMFPINRIIRSKYNDFTILYIPLCFLLIQLCPAGEILLIGLYIPLCFLLIVCPQGAERAPGRLYIPLCFLLIPYPGRPAVFRGPALHSTMFPINPDEDDSGSVVRFRLYIPLCFLLI